MGYIPAPPLDFGQQTFGGREPFRPNLDRHGMPLDFASYMWQVYGRIVEDRSPMRMAGTAAPPRLPDPTKTERR